MKIKSIAAICKKGKQVVLYNRYESGGTLQQYIGDGMTAYPVSGLPELDEESILTIFDVPENSAKTGLCGCGTFRKGSTLKTRTQTKR